MPSHLDAVLPLAGAWFLRSGIQEPEGGVARYYLTDSGRNARISTEITGYTVSALVYLYRRLDDFEYLEAARRAASFLARRAWNRELAVFPFEYSTNGPLPSNLAYFFDSGIIVRGLLTLWRVTPEGEWLDTAVATGRSMMRDFVNADAVHPVVSLPSRAPLPHAGNWSKNPGCYQLKAALAWYDLYEVTSDRAFLEAYERVLAKSLETHRDFLPGEQDPALVMDRLHAYCYFMEGLLPRYADPLCAAAVREGIARVSALLREIAPVFERSDVCAQLLRVRLFADRLGVEPLDRSAAHEEVERIQRYQFADSDRARHGGFWFGTREGRLLPYVNPVSTAFCMQALEMWRLAEAGEFKPNRHELI